MLPSTTAYTYTRVLSLPQQFSRSQGRCDRRKPSQRRYHTRLPTTEMLIAVKPLAVEALSEGDCDSGGSGISHAPHIYTSHWHLVCKTVRFRLRWSSGT